MTKPVWKHLVKKMVIESTLHELHTEKTKLSKGNTLPEYTELKPQKYLQFLKPEDARTVFKLRTEVYDIKRNCQYQYDDVKCRLCGSEPEDTNHIMNDCLMIQRSNGNVDITCVEEHNMNEVVSRVKNFEEQLEEIISLESTLGALDS